MTEPRTEAGRSLLEDNGPHVETGEHSMLTRILAIEAEAAQGAAPRGYIRIRTPDDPNGWTAEGDLVAGMPYVYSSGDVAVDIEWFEEVKP